MFKKQNLPFEADSYFNVYSGCNVGCKFCKFNKIKVQPTKNEFNAFDYKNQRVLVSYSTEPLPFDDVSHTVNIINQLHNVNAKILFLTRHPQRLIKILDSFLKMIS